MEDVTTQEIIEQIIEGANPVEYLKEDLVSFSYITEVPEVINDREVFAFGVKAYNLFLTLVWLLIAMWLFDKLFICFGKFYRKGSD